MRVFWMRVSVLIGLAMSSGCAIGYNSVLFATRSNMGVDVDTAPPNLEVDISREEGVIEPTFEGGQTVPVMASFSAKTGAFQKFFWGVGSTFSTGEAAFTMSYLYADDTPKDKAAIPYERVTLSEAPHPKLPFGITVDYLNKGDVKPVLFGTDTSLGLKVKWSGATAQYPSSIHLGFKRKEAALAPVTLATNRIPVEVDPTKPDKPNDVSKKPLEADIPSLLATIDSGVSIPGTNAELTYLQYFATGEAANNLARQKAVREAMLKRADPGQDLAQAMAEATVQKNRENARTDAKALALDAQDLIDKMATPGDVDRAKEDAVASGLLTSDAGVSYSGLTAAPAAVPPKTLLDVKKEFLKKATRRVGDSDKLQKALKNFVAVLKTRG